VPGLIPAASGIWPKGSLPYSSGRQWQFRREDLQPKPIPSGSKMCVSIHAAAALIVCTILSGCASSGSTQGPYGPAENIPSNLRMVNDELGKMELTLLEGAPVLVGPQR